MEVFEKLSVESFENMTFVGFCMYAIVCWKHDDQQLHDLQRMHNRTQTVMKSQSVFLEAVRESGVCPRSKSVSTEPLTTEGLVNLTKAIEGLKKGLVQGYYQKRSE